MCALGLALGSELLWQAFSQKLLNQDAVVYSVVLIAFPREDLCELLSVDTWRALESDAGFSIESRSQLSDLMEGIGATGSLYPGHEHSVGALSCMGAPPPWLRDISDSVDCLCCHSKDHTSPWWRSSCLRGCEEDIWRFNGFRRKVCQSSPFLT